MLGEDEGRYIVCQKFFLSTIGHKCEQIISTKLENSAQATTSRKDRRGKHTPANKKDSSIAEIVDKHIFSFGPAVSHYRRKHVSKRLYLSPEFNIANMHKDFCTENTGAKISYEFYRKRVNAYNISFVKLREEE